jgi:beta-glucanase (GH16 family)
MIPLSLRALAAFAFAFAFAGASSSSSPTAPASFCAAPGFSLEWSDEFSGSAIDASSWSVSANTQRDDSACREAICMPANVAVTGGQLFLTARRENVAWANFTTGAVNTHGKRGWGARPGAPVRICIAGTVPVGPNSSAASYWPAFWLMPDDASCWPDHGELDLMEMINGDGVEHYTYHVSPANATVCHGGPVQRAAGGNGPVSPGAHEYAVEIAMGKLSFAVDGVVRWSSSSTDLPVHDVAWGVILNFAIGRPWAYSPTDTTNFPVSTTVDYVRVARGGN